MKQLYLHKNRDPSSSGPTEQLSINNEGRFTLTKVFKIRSEVNKQINKNFACVLCKKSYKKNIFMKVKLILLVKIV